MLDRNNQNGSGWLSRYRSWRDGLSPVQRRRWRILCLVVVAMLAIVLAFNAFVRKPNVPTIQTGADVSSNTNQAEVSGRRSGVYTFLVVGKDTGGGGNTDTMILAVFDTKEKTLNAMSLPRDTMTNVSWNNKKLNTVYNYYKGKDKATQVEKGITALKTHVAKLTGILPDFYVMVEWNAVGQLVDAIGGVTFDVPYDMNYDDPEQNLFIHQEKGERRLTGDDAMQVIRWRKNNGQYGNFQIGDSGRMKVQQDFLVAVAKECLQIKHLMNASEFARIFTENVNTDLTVGNLAWLAQQAMGMNAEKDIHFHTMPFTNYSRGTAYVLPIVDELLTILNDGMNPYKKEITAEDLEVLLLNADGSMALTSGTLEDSNLAKPRNSGKPEQVQEPVKPVVVPEQPEQPVQEPPAEVPAEDPQQGQEETVVADPSTEPPVAAEEATEQTELQPEQVQEVQGEVLPADLAAVQ